MADIDWVTLGPEIARILANFLAAERARTGLTTEEVFAKAGAALDANEQRLIEDLERLQK